MKLSFFGSPSFAVKILAKIHKRFPVSLVVSQKDKPVGRKQIRTPTPVTDFARKNNITIINNISINRFIDIFEKEKVDLAIVAAYGKIIPNELLNKVKYGFFNIHYSLLPKYRGASPVQFAILNGEKETGVTIFKLDEKLDHGPIYSQVRQSISPTITIADLIEVLTNISIQPILDLISYIQNENKLPKLVEQNQSHATYTRTLTKNDGFIPFMSLKKVVNNIPLTNEDYPPLTKEQLKKGSLTMKSGGARSCSAGQFNHLSLYNFIRALNPWPIAWTTLPNGKRLKLISSSSVNGRLILNKVQVEGKSISTDSKFINSLVK